ncbi:MAG: mechanosensitive ion channel family protein [Planctomycetes bacterium]|nr:mechanosensitive ion channel family protein [Planctomycetota bacterium]
MFGLGDTLFEQIALSWGGVILLAFFSNWVAKRVILRGLRAVAKKTSSQWDDVMVERKVFERLSQLAPALVVYLSAPVLFRAEADAAAVDYLRRVANVWMILAGARTLHALLDSLVVIGLEQESTRTKPVRSYAQVVQLIVWVSAGILSVAVLMEKSPSALLTGLGAMTAVLLLVFRDTILGFIASLRIEANEMLRVGDWVEMPKYGADGDVTEIGLHTVKIQNWDKTITTIPTHAFMSDSFKNWRGMTESGGRRIKRSLKLDMTTVRFLGSADIERLSGIQSLRPYLETRAAEIDLWNQENGVDQSTPVNGRKLTNLGTFRAYVEAYLRQLGPIREDMTFLVRQLAPTPEGIPLELYCFSGEQRWAQYEGIMGDIFDHLLSVLAEFDLKAFQVPSGSDFRSGLSG